eukprot:TRINITY_DN6711_c0_g1_i1.p1 TRINITY_DN6711_c0_g1~~TRINITY_DN6711_c0_g1_i1.p1  ORF type:complete len:251 (-),score=75.84 TRINITY_DN6711_c0_g1_i1:59-811(-)
MADLFDNYEEDFLELRNRIEKKISSIPTLEGSRRESEITEAESDIAEIEQVLKSMSLSARNVSSGKNLQPKIKEYENEASKLKTSLRKATMQMRAESDHQALFKRGVREDTSMGQREKLLSNTERLGESSNELRRARAEAEGTVQVGIEIMEELENQRTVMMSIRERLGRVNENLGQAKRIMRTMTRRVATNKLITAIIILFLLLAILLIVYIKFIPKGSSTPEPTPTEGTAVSTSAYSTSTVGSTEGFM